MRPVTLTQVGAGSTAPCPMDIRQNPQNTTLQCWVLDEPSLAPSPASDTGYVVETTDSNVWGTFPFTTAPDPADWLWTPHPDFVDDVTGDTVPKTENWVGNLAFPPTAVRMRLTDDYEATVELRIVQSGF